MPSSSPWVIRCSSEARQGSLTKGNDRDTGIFQGGRRERRGYNRTVHTKVCRLRGPAACVVTREKVQVVELKKAEVRKEFDYFITAKRAGFESHEPIQPNTHFTADMKTKDDFEKLYAKTDDVTVSAMRTLLISNGILTKEGKLNTETANKLGWNVRIIGCHE